MVWLLHAIDITKQNAVMLNCIIEIKPFLYEVL